MTYIWDEEKRALNIKKHKLDFKFAYLVFEGTHITNLNSYEYEERYQTIGMLSDKTVVVIHTDQIDNTRIISMRKAVKNEINEFRRAITGFK